MPKAFYDGLIRLAWPEIKLATTPFISAVIASENVGTGAETKVSVSETIAMYTSKATTQPAAQTTPKAEATEAAAEAAANAAAEAQPAATKEAAVEATEGAKGKTVTPAAGASIGIMPPMTAAAAAAAVAVAGAFELLLYDASFKALYDAADCSAIGELYHIWLMKIDRRHLEEMEIFEIFLSSLCCDSF
ncbi:unnamed protein product [Onchocerca ochengi]|uniref:Uncharacterized protein n=1 Tax=Onchocerca ochengi TaxID=42157 RepID=A0A182E2R6_ONCOC|nr:unnamed protein product [Onchocerca ochengi]